MSASFSVVLLIILAATEPNAGASPRHAKATAAADLPASRDHPENVAGPAATLTLPPFDRTKEGGPGKPGVRAIGSTRTIPPLALPTQQFETDRGCATISVIVSPGAKQIRAHFTRFEPADAEGVYVYAVRDAGDLHGPYQSAHFSGDFWTPPVVGDAIAIESVRAGPCHYGEPFPFDVDAISHIYEAIDGPVAWTNAGTCELPVPPPWAEAAKSAALLQFVDSGIESLCSGTLLSTIGADLTPYVLTANHCIDSQAAAQSVRAIWRFENAGQSVAERPHSDVAELVLTKSSESGNDYSLLLIRGVLPPNLLSWAGWATYSLVPSLFVVGLHHPGPVLADAYTRYAAGTVAGVTPPPNAYLTINWDPGGGIVEAGSSGSGLWAVSPIPFLVGQLRSGPGECGSLNGYDYGAFTATFDDIALRTHPNSMMYGPEGAAPYDIDRNCSWCRPPGTYPGFVVTTKPVWHNVFVRSGGTAHIDLSFVNTYGDIDMELYRGYYSPYGGSIQWIASSSGSSNSESVDIVNQGEDTYYAVKVFLTTGTRNTYKATFTVSPDCWYSLSPHYGQLDGAGGAGELIVTGAPQGCSGSWTASSNASWLSASGNGSGSGRWHLGYTYAGFPATDPPSQRNASIVFSGPFGYSDLYTLWQDSFQQLPDCAYYISTPTSVHLPPEASGAAISVASSVVSPTGGCRGSWSVSINSPWLESDIVSGNGAVFHVGVSAGDNISVSSRHATVSFSGPFPSGGSVSVVQDPTVNCTYSFANEVWSSPEPYYLNSGLTGALAGGSGKLLVSGTPTGCTGSWTASTSAPWLTLTGASGGSGSGPWQVPYSYTAAPTNSIFRSAEIVLEGSFPVYPHFPLYQRFWSAKATYSCDYQINPTSATIPSAGGNGSVEITASAKTQDACQGSWSVTSGAAWLTLTGATGGSGTGTTVVNYTVAPNSGASRSGRLNFSFQNLFTVFQAQPVAASTAPFAGDGQSVQVATQFAPLKAIVKDAQGLPTPGITVTFAVVPAGGAGGSFASTPTAVTDAGGIATAPALTANNVAGRFSVTASADAAVSTTFNLANWSAMIAAPSSVAAGAVTSASVLIAWSPSAGATQYEILRRSGSSAYSAVGTSASTSFLDSTVTSNQSYLYRVRTSAPNPSSYSGVDLATTIVFTDAALSGTAVKAIHFSELRVAANAVRALAGIGSYSFSDAVLAPGSTTVKSVHLTQLRAALDAARSALALESMTYTHPAILPGSSRISAADVDDLRRGVR